MIGTSLNQYRITASIGAGGMGEVFRARDTRLNREVAIKVLPKDFASDADRLRRLEQEAKTLAALNHPNVLTIHDAGVHEGAPYLVSELLEGQTLREAMSSVDGSGLPVRKATDFALQIAHGLAAAHGKGIIHRDLKPENIFVTKDGRVKILDFGLAKLRSVGTRSTGSQTEKIRDGVESIPTIRVEAATLMDSTAPGVVLGTPAYMSPEQVRGEPTDHRTDIFAFGCVLYEMLTGTRAFRRNTPVESMNAVLKEMPPELGTLNPSLPLSLAHIVERCLEKQPDNRFQSAKDLAFALTEIASPRPAAQERRIPEPRLWKRPIVAVGAASVLALAAWLFVKFISNSNPSASASKKVVPLTGETNKSVAVLPFVNMSPDKSDEYLSDGMTEELLNALAKLKGLRVPGRSSSFAFKGKNEEGIFRKVGEQLHVSTVLEGSVRKAGDKLRITAQLIKVEDGFHLWSETYDRDMTNIFAIQSDIAARVAEAMKVQLLGGDAQPKKPTENIEAYKLYLQGRQLWNRRTSESISQAISVFNRAVAADPTYALAYAGLADCYAILSDYTGVPFRETAPKARAAALKAIELDDSLGEPQAALGSTRANLDWDWLGAEAELRRAIELNPNYATAHHWLGNIYKQQAKFKEALAEIERAQEIDPLSPIINVNVAIGLFETGQHDQAIQMLQKQIALDSGFAMAHGNLGEFYLRIGKLREAVAALEKAHQADREGPWYWGRLGFAYARVGRSAEAQRELRELEDRKRQGQNFSLDIALLQHGLGNDDQALAALEQTVEDRSSDLPELFYSSLWEDLRPHPRAQAILRKMKLIK